jgi:processive 1,2-diacylglycerol beta-glucosyltransferase
MNTILLKRGVFRLKIMVISSNYTGSGHKSVYEAIKQKFSEEDGVEIKFVEGFALSGPIGPKVAKSYGFLSRRAKLLWKTVWLMAEHTSLPVALTRTTMEKRFIEEVESFKPDLILSLHPNYNSSVIDVLEKHGKKIPVATVISDIVTISSLWMDKRADVIFCPTKECAEACQKRGIILSRIRYRGLPVRQEFFSIKHSRALDGNSVLEYLIISGAEGVGSLDRIAKEILENFPSRVTIIAGRNEKLKRKLEKSFEDKYGGRITILGYVNNIYEIMAKTDVIITRCSPNTIMEASVMNIPFIAFGKPLPQEKGNTEFVEKNRLGLVCKSERDVPEKVRELVADNLRLYKRIQQHQKEYIKKNPADDIANEIKNRFGTKYMS